MKHLFLLISITTLTVRGIAQNVGIGTTAPPTKLTVTIPNTGFGIEHSSATSTVIIKSFLDANVGQIGTYTNHPFDIMANNGSAQLRVMPTGVVGVGEATPTLGGLVVNKAIGNTYGIFGSNTTGVSLIGNWPGVGFNSYYNAGNKFMGTGYAGNLSFSPVDGQFIFSSSSASGTTNNTATLNSRLSLYPDGGMAINGPNAVYVFKDRTLTNYDGWGWYANNGNAGLYRYTSGGDVMTINNIGNVGIGTTGPAARLDVRASSSSYAAYVGQSGAGTGFGVANNSASAAALFASNSGGPAIIADGSVGIGNIFPKAGRMLDVKGRMRIRGTANDAVNTAGLYLDGPTTEERAFIGMLNNDKIGLYGAGGAGWSTVMDVNNGNLGVGTTTPNSKLQVSGGVSLPFKRLNDENYTVTDNDYTIYIAVSAPRGINRTITLPSATNRGGRMYIISAAIPISNGGTDYSTITVIDGGTGANIIGQSLSITQSGLLGSNYQGSAFLYNHYDYYGGAGKANDIFSYKQTSITVQSDGANWKIVSNDFSNYFIYDFYD